MISTQFLQNCMAGDEEAITTLVRTYQRGVFQLALSILDDVEMPPGAWRTGMAGDPHPVVLQAEIATRQTFIAAINRLGRYREDVPFDTWLYAVTIEVARKRYRRWRAQRWWGRLFSRAAGGQSGAAANLSRADLELWSAVRRLDEKLRIPVVLRYYHDFTIHDIAKMLRLSEGAVHARLDAAREKLTARAAPAADPRPSE
jgi:RNA polymerase sigma-70 factor (ECF subfamily)